MRFSTILPLLLAAGVAQAQFGQGQGQGQQGQGQGQQGQGQGQAAQNGQNQGQGQAAQNGQNGQNGQNQGGNNNGGGGNANALALDPNNVQTNSQSDGLDAGAEDGQAASETDQANFINFCTGKTLTNGLQVKEGSCNGIVMGDIPAAAKMVSAAMQFPKDGDVIDVGQDINFQVKINNLEAGTFTNPDVTYYAAPQGLGQSGGVIGHTHITVQDITQTGDEPPDAQEFAFFKGINDAGDGQGTLSAALAGGLDAGTFRVCSMTSSANHQPVLMPVAQRGPQDDCVRFTVQAGGGGNNNNNGGNGGNNNQQGQQAQNGQQGQQAAQGQGQQAAQAAQGGQGQQAAQGQQAQQGQQAAQGQGQQAAQGAQGGQGGGRRGRGRGRGRFAARAYIA